MGLFKNCKRVVVKVGTSTLTHATGQLNLRRIETIVKVLSDLKNGGKEIILVSSGAVSAGIAKSGLGHRPISLEEKQAMASIGQSELMKIYDRFFSDYGHKVARSSSRAPSSRSPFARRRQKTPLTPFFAWDVSR